MISISRSLTISICLLTVFSWDGMADTDTCTSSEDHLTQIQQLETEMEKLKAEREAKDQIIKELKQQNGRGTGHCQTELSEALTQAEQLQENLSSCAKRATDCNKLKYVFKVKRWWLEKRMGAAQDELAKLNSDLKHTKGERQSCKSDKGALEIQIGKMQAEITELKSEDNRSQTSPCDDNTKSLEEQLKQSKDNIREIVEALAYKNKLTQGFKVAKWYLQKRFVQAQDNVVRLQEQLIEEESARQECQKELQEGSVVKGDEQPPPRVEDPLEEEEECTTMLAECQASNSELGMMNQGMRMVLDREGGNKERMKELEVKIEQAGREEAKYRLSFGMSVLVILAYLLSVLIEYIRQRMAESDKQAKLLKAELKAAQRKKKHKHA